MQIGPRNSYSVNQVPETASPEALPKELKTNEEIDILSVSNTDGAYHISGKRIDLEELAGEFPQVAEGLAEFDSNHDGHVDHLEIGPQNDPPIFITLNLFIDHSDTPE